jgi:hypothetical protein
VYGSTRGSGDRDAYALMKASAAARTMNHSSSVPRWAMTAYTSSFTSSVRDRIDQRHHGPVEQAHQLVHVGDDAVSPWTESGLASTLNIGYSQVL